MFGGPGQDLLLRGSGLDSLSGDDGDDFLNGGAPAADGDPVLCSEARNRE